MDLTADIKKEIRELFTYTGEELSDTEINEIALNLLNLALQVSDIDK